MHSLFKFRSSTRHLPLLRCFSLSSKPQETLTLEPIDLRKLPTAYDASTFDPTNHRPPPSPRVWPLVDEVSALTLAEIAELSQILIQKMGIKEPPTVTIMGAGAGVAMAGKGGSEMEAAAGKEEGQKKEKMVFELKLEGFDAASKIKVIKEVRGFTDLGLKEAKELVEKAPVVVMGRA